MRSSKFSQEPIVKVLKQVEADQTIVAECRTTGISEQTYHRSKAEYGGLEVSEARRFKPLEDENRRLKTFLADLTLDSVAIKDVVANKF